VAVRSRLRSALHPLCGGDITPESLAGCCSRPPLRYSETPNPPVKARNYTQPRSSKYTRPLCCSLGPPILGFSNRTYPSTGYVPCALHNPLRGSTTQTELTTPDSPKRLQRQHTHKRQATPAPAHTTPAHSDLLRTACAPASTHSNGFCVIWVYISSSSSSVRRTVRRATHGSSKPYEHRTSTVSNGMV
jgi:hypothetical protein